MVKTIVLAAIVSVTLLPSVAPAQNVAPDTQLQMEARRNCHNDGIYAGVGHGLCVVPVAPLPTETTSELLRSDAIAAGVAADDL